MFQTAIRFIRYDRTKSIGILVGIVVSVFLVGQQLGTLQFIVEIMNGLITNAQPGSTRVWVIDNTSNNVNELIPLDARLVNEIRSVEGVNNTYPIVVSNVNVTLPNGQSAPFVIVGSEAPFFAGGPLPAKIEEGSLEDLYRTKSVSVDFFDAKNLKTDLKVGTPIEINGKSAKVVMETKNVQGFGGHYMYTNLANAQFFSGMTGTKVSIIAVQLEDDSQAQNVIRQINRTFPGVTAWDTEALGKSTSRELLSATNMGLSFGSLVVFAILTGFFIIGLTLYSAVIDRIGDYGTFKAIGATNGYVRRLILMQALIFAVIGFCIALMLLYFFKKGVVNVGLIVHLSPQLIALLLSVTLLICIGGSLFAIHKINKLEPASVFN